MEELSLIKETYEFFSSIDLLKFLEITIMFFFGSLFFHKETRSRLAFLVIDFIESVTISRTRKNVKKMVQEIGIVYNAMQEILVRTKADRVCIFSYHNSVKFPIVENSLKVTMEKEVVNYDKNITLIKDIWQEQKVHYQQFLMVKKILVEEYVVINNADELENGDLKEIYMKHNTKSSAAFLVNTTNSAIFVLFLFFSKPKEFSQEEITKLRIQAIQLKKYLV